MHALRRAALLMIPMMLLIGSTSASGQEDPVTRLDRADLSAIADSTQYYLVRARVLTRMQTRIAVADSLLRIVDAQARELSAARDVIDRLEEEVEREHRWGEHWYERSQQAIEVGLERDGPPRWVQDLIAGAAGYGVCRATWNP